jgi:hypothetical protein
MRGIAKMKMISTFKIQTFSKLKVQNRPGGSQQLAGQIIWQMAAF